MSELVVVVFGLAALLTAYVVGLVAGFLVVVGVLAALFRKWT